MLQWEVVGPNAYRAVSGMREYRVFYDPEASGRQDSPWILEIRELRDDGAHAPASHGAENQPSSPNP
jgi:hypothetical protein